MRHISRPPMPPGMSEVKYSHCPSGDTAGCPWLDMVSALISNFTGALHFASERWEVYISTPVWALGSRRALVRYIVCPSGVNDIMPSSSSLLSSPSTGSGRFHCPCSSLAENQMSPFFMPVISLRLLPDTFSLVVVKYIWSSERSRNIGAKSARRELNSFEFLTT